MTVQCTGSQRTACALSGHLRRETYKEPDAVYIQYILLMMSTKLLETCKGIWKNIINKRCIKLEHEIKYHCLKSDKCLVDNLVTSHFFTETIATKFHLHKAMSFVSELCDLSISYTSALHQSLSTATLSLELHAIPCELKQFLHWWWRVKGRASNNECVISSKKVKRLKTH